MVSFVSQALYRRFLFSACAAAALALPAAAVAFPGPAPGPPIGDGERLVYRVSWAIIPGAGRITVDGESLRDASGAKLFSVTTDTETRGLARFILPFTARARSFYDGPSGRLVFYAESSQLRQRESYHSMTFDYARHRVQYVDRGNPANSRYLPLPAGDPMDLINSLLEARWWNLRPGQTHDILAFFEDQFYPLTVHAIGEQMVQTPLGDFQSVMLEPRMEKSPPKGMFRKGGQVRVWIAADDPRHLPVRFQVRFKFGVGVATLTGYHPAVAGGSGRTAPIPADQK